MSKLPFHLRNIRKSFQKSSLWRRVSAQRRIICQISIQSLQLKINTSDLLKMEGYLSFLRVKVYTKLKAYSPQQNSNVKVIFMQILVVFCHCGIVVFL